MSDLFEVCRAKPQNTPQFTYRYELHFGTKNLIIFFENCQMFLTISFVIVFNWNNFTDGESLFIKIISISLFKASP